jgi:hypothetical protein
MAMNEMWSGLEGDAARREFDVRRPDVAHAEVDYRWLSGLAVGTEEQAGAGAVEERQVAVGVEMREAEYVAVPLNTAVVMSLTGRAI